MASFLSRLLVEVWSFTAPLRRAVANGEQLSEFFQRFGYQLPLGSHNDVAALRTALTDLTDELTNLPDIAQMTQQEAAVVATRASEVFVQIARVGSAGGNVGNLGIGSEFLAEVFDVALYDYLSDRVPMLVQVLLALEALVLEDVLAASPEGRDVDYVRVRFDWARLGQFLRDTDTWADQVYGWGRDFKYNKALVRLSNVIEAIGLPAHVEAIDPARLGAFLSNIPTVTIAGQPVHDLVQVKLPIFDVESAPDVAGDVTVTGEAGFTILPFGDLAQRAQMGMALAPFVAGGVAGEQPITQELKLTINAAAQATGGAFVVFRPSGIEIAGGASANASFEIGFRYANADNSEILLIGESTGTRLALKAAILTLGGNLDGDLFAAFGAKELKLVIDLSGDGLLGSLFSGPITIDAGDMLVGWRPGRGVYFEGGTSIGLTIPLDLDLGPINIAELGVAVDWADALEFTFAVTGDLTIGPMYAFVEGIGVVTTLVPAENGVLGRYDLDFASKPPTGYAIALTGGAISGGGRLSMLEGEYRGALALKFETFGLSAFGILNTNLPGGRGFSFVASIFGEFSIAIGAGFFLTGVGGVIGLHRTVDTDELRQVINEGRFDLQLFPPDPKANARTLLADMAAIYPIMIDQHFFGPVARVAWGKPTLVEGKLGMILEVGTFTRLLILGNVGAKLPTKESSLVVLQISFFGEIDFAAGTISFDASLAGSRILDFPVSGEAAVRTGWAKRVDHVASFGGLHPRYPRPASLPDLKRLSINFGSNNPRVTLTSYAAITLGSLQFGARADLYARGPKIRFVGRLAAEGSVYFDALIYFNPFRFEADLGGGLSLLVDGDVVMGLGFDLRLSGPNPFHINGKVWATVCGVDVDFGISHTWGSSRSLPSQTANPVTILRDALANTVFEPLPVEARMESVVFAPVEDTVAPIDPYNGARFVQRAIPLAVSIERVGEVQIAGGANRFDIRVYEPDGVAVAVSEARADFVHGHFWNQSEGQRLRTPAFEEHKAGFDVDAKGLWASVDLAIQSDYQYEMIAIPINDDREAPGVIGQQPEDVPVAFTKRWMRVYHGAVAEPFERFRDTRKAVDAITVARTEFVTPAARAAAMTAAGATAARMRDELRRRVLPFASARLEYLSGVERKRDVANPIVADYVAAAG